MPEGSSKNQTPRQSNRLTGLKKRQQIEVAGRAMFLWVAAAAVALSFFVATGQYLFSKWQYNNKVLGAKYEASGTLSENIEASGQLKQEIDALVANQDLASVKTKEEDPNIKSVLDALPTTADPAALATSLQEVVLARSGVSIESISVPADSETEDEESAGPKELQFSFVVSGSYEKMKNLINDLQRTIRPMKLVSASLSGNDASLRGTFEVITYYQPAKSVEIKKEVVR